MNKRFTIAAALVFFFLTTDVTAETEIKAEIDKPNITIDEDIVYKLTIVSSEKSIPTPDLPKFEGFEVLSSAQTSEISITRAEQETFIIYVVILKPTNIGKFKIEPSSISIEDEIYSSQEFEIEVKPAEVKPQLEPEKKTPSPTKDKSESEQTLL